jgi:NAD(P)-dependent dehydrogenase (short-subunit alcohol dehydrogenase family)
MKIRGGNAVKVQGKVCVVTGAAGGIGEAIARRYAREGAKAVVVADRDGSRLAKVASDIKGLAVACDVAQEGEIRHLVAEAERHYGPVDVFFSNAGISRGGHEDASDRDWADSWAIHVMAHVYAARAVVPGMLERKSGYLLNTASAAGLLASLGSAPYGVTKHAGVALAEHLAIQYGDRGIVVSVLCPQAVDTNMLRMAGATAASASVDGVLNTEAVAQSVIEAMDAETFLILPHPEVKEYMARKLDRDRWLRGMRRLRDKTGEGQRRA